MLIYPRMVNTPLHLHRNPASQKLPYVFSKVQDNNHVLIDHIITDDGTPDEVIEHGFTQFIPELVDLTFTERITAIKQLTGVNKATKLPEEYQNVIILKRRGEKSKPIMIYQKKDSLPKWFKKGKSPGEQEISENDAKRFMIKISKKLDIDPAALEASTLGEIRAAHTTDQVLNRFWQMMNISRNAPFLIANAKIEAKDIAGLKDILEQFSEEDCRQLLFVAIAANQLDAVRLLKSRIQTDNLDVNEKLLIRAIKNGNIEIVKEIVDMGAISPDKNYSNQTALYHAVERDNSEIIDYLCSKGASQKQIIGALNQTRASQKPKAFLSLLKAVAVPIDPNEAWYIFTRTFDDNRTDLALRAADKFTIPIYNKQCGFIFNKLREEGKTDEWIAVLKFILSKASSDTNDNADFCSTFLSCISFRTSIMQHWKDYNNAMKTALIDIFKEIAVAYDKVEADMKEDNPIATFYEILVEQTSDDPEAIVALEPLHKFVTDES